MLFAVDSAQVSPRAYDLIASVAEDARRNARAHVEVQGFTDTSGTHDYNMTLSQARAEHVAREADEACLEAAKRIVFDPACAKDGKTHFKVWQGVGFFLD